MDDEMLNDLWRDIESGYSTILNDSIFSTFVYRLIHQYSLQINIIPTGQLYTTFNTLLNTLRQSPTRANHNNLFNWIYHTFHTLNEYQSFEDYLLNQDDVQNIEVNIPVNPEGESDVELSSLYGDEDDEDDQQNGNGRNPYALLKEHEGKFTAQFKARKPHLRQLKSLKEFAHYILANPTEFNKITKQRANYYRNLIERKGGMFRSKKSPQDERYDSVEIDLPATQNIIERQQMQMEKQMQIEKQIQDRKKQEQNILYNLKKKEYSKNFDPIKIKSVRETAEADPRIKELYNKWSTFQPLTTNEMLEYLQITDYYKKLPKTPENIGRGRISKKMIKDLRAYHRQVGGKISAKDFELMLQETYKSPDKRDKNIGDYSIDESLSTPENVVYHNPKTGETKVAYRGTEGTLKDWGNNALYAFGLHNTSKRYKRSNEIQKQVEQKYGTVNLDVLGHSQSGAYAQELGKNAKNVIVLNPATHPGYTPKTKNATVVRSTGDAVSGLKYLNPLNWGKKKTADVEIKAKTYNPIEEHMPSVLERLPGEQMLGEGRTYKQKFNKKYGFAKDKSHSLSDISKITGYDKKHLQMIIDKGKGAYYSNKASVRPNVKSPEQWAMARLYASLDPTSKAHKIDKSHLIKNKKLRNLCDCGDANCKFC